MRKILSVRSEKGKASIKILAVIIAVVVVAVGGFIVYRTIFSMSPKEMFLKAHLNRIEKVFEKEDNQRLSNQLLKHILENSYKINTQFSLGLDVSQDEESTEIMKMASTLLENLVIEVDTENNVEENTQFSTLNFKLGGTKLVDFNLLNSEETLAVQCPVLYNRYLALDYQDLGKFFDKYGIEYAGPSEKYNWKQLKEALKLDDEILKEIMKDYAGFVTEFLKDEDFTLNTEESIEIADTHVKARNITLQIDEDRSRELIEGIFKMAANDERIVEIVSESLSNISEELGKTGLSGILFHSFNIDYRVLDMDVEELTSREKVRDAVKKSLEQFAEEAGKCTCKDGFKVELYIDKKMNIIREKVDFAVEDSEEHGIEVEIAGTGYINNNKDNEERNYDFNFELTHRGGSFVSVEGEAGYLIQGTIDKNDLKSDFSLETDIAYGDSMIEKGFKLRLNTNSEYDLKPVFDTPVLDSNNSIEIIELDEYEQQMLMMEIGIKLQQFFMQNKTLLELVGVKGM